MIFESTQKSTDRPQITVDPKVLRRMVIQRLIASIKKAECDSSKLNRSCAEHLHPGRVNKTTGYITSRDFGGRYLIPRYTATKQSRLRVINLLRRLLVKS